MSTSDSRLLILGAGGHGRVVADAAVEQAAWGEVSATDRDPARCLGELLPGVPLLGADAALLRSNAVHVAVGDGAARERECTAIGMDRLVSVIHPRASVSAHAQLGQGCFIAAQAVVAAGAQLGDSVIVNHGAVVDHDCRIGSFSHIAPRAALGGAVVVGRRVLIGAGATILPGMTVADDVVVGAGAVVRDNLLERGVYVGVPARRSK